MYMSWKYFNKAYGTSSSCSVAMLWYVMIRGTFGHFFSAVQFCIFNGDCSARAFAILKKTPVEKIQEKKSQNMFTSEGHCNTNCLFASSLFFMPCDKLAKEECIIYGRGTV